MTSNSMTVVSNASHLESLEVSLHLMIVVMPLVQEKFDHQSVMHHQQRFFIMNESTYLSDNGNGLRLSLTE